MRTAAILLISLYLAPSVYSHPQHLTSITEYLPENCPSDGSVDLTEPINQALAERSALYFPGSNDPESPWVYALRPVDFKGIRIRPGSVLVFGPNSLVRRLPCVGEFIILGDHSRIAGCVIDGNKYAHWPAYKKLDKNQTGIQVGNHCVVEDCFVYNNPGHAFRTGGTGSKFIRCRAENIGYLDVRYGADAYRGEWDEYSGDGFYIGGTHNLMRECVAYDCFRWDLCLTNSEVIGNTFIDCHGGDVNWQTYGLADIENAGPNNRLIRCTSPNSPIYVSSPRVEVIDCVASAIRCYGADYVTIRGCTTTREGIALAWPSKDESMHYGGKSPMITGNRVFLAGPTGGVAPEAIHIESEDGRGIVTGNAIHVYEGEEGRGEPIRVTGIDGGPGENQVVFGQWNAEEQHPKPSLIRGWVDWDHLARRKEDRMRQDDP